MMQTVIEALKKFLAEFLMWFVETTLTRRLDGLRVTIREVEADLASIARRQRSYVN